MFLIPASSLQLQQLNRGPKAPSVGCWFSLPHLISNCLTSCLHSGYIIVRLIPSSCGRHKSHSIQPVHGQSYILIFLDGCSCYLHRCISYFDCLTGVIMLHNLVLSPPQKTKKRKKEKKTKKTQHGIHGKQRGGRKGKQINPLTAQRNA